jgi:hypothetical protein
LRFALSCSNVSFMPLSFAPPHPKQRFVAFGSSLILSLKDVAAFPYSSRREALNQPKI